MRRFRYGVNKILKITMAAAGGFLILALTGKYKKEQGSETIWQTEYKIFETYKEEVLGEGLKAMLRLAYPMTFAGETEEGREDESWTEKIIVWIGNREPRVRYERQHQIQDSPYGDPDPSFGRYMESQRVVEESRYLLFGGGEETGIGREDMADSYGTGGYGDDSLAAAGGGEGKVTAEIQNLPRGTLAYHQNPGLTAVGTSYVMEQLADYDFLMKHFYSVHSSTTASRDEMDAARLLSEDLSIEKEGENPQILIYHTHSQETFADYGPDRQYATVVGIGDYLTELLEAKGYHVIHDRSVYDLVDGELNRSRAYDYALNGITAILQQNPSVQVVLDVHRDGVREDLHMVSEVNGKPTAPIMFFNGMSQTPEGPIEYLPNAYKEENLAFSLQMQLDAAAYYPGLTRKIYLKGFRYNLHLRPRSALIEVGAQTNTYEEARNAMEPLAELLDMVLSGENGNRPE